MSAAIPPGGLAVAPDGNLADMPRELAEWINIELLDVVALLHAASREADGCLLKGAGMDVGYIHNAPSRAVTLIRLADSKVREALQEIAPYF